VAAAYRASALEFYLYDATAVPLVLGEINGIVVCWGKRENAGTAWLFVNGKQIDTDSTYSLPAGTPPDMRIGHTAAGGATPSSYLSANLQQVIVGRNPISQAEARALSSWMKRQYISDIG
jgi:hypothetical protein